MPIKQVRPCTQLRFRDDEQKRRAEEAAGPSLNAWLVRLIDSALEPQKQKQPKVAK